MILVMKPYDSLLFREPRPFDVNNHVARTILPLPQTLAGAVRSAIYVKYGSEVKDLIGFGKEEPEFEILGHFFYRYDGKFELLVESPHDVTQNLGLVKPHRIDKLGITILMDSEGIKFRPFNGFLKFSGLIDYLQGRIAEDSVVERQKIFKKERRVGIALTKAKVTKEEHFYQVEMLRFSDDCGIAVWVEDGVDFDDEGILGVGGERRFVKFEKREEPECITNLRSKWKKIRDKINETGRLKIYLATPAILGAKGYSSKLDYDLLGDIGIERVRSVNFIGGKPVIFSGWDFVTRKPKPTRYAVPAGSVYFVEFEGEVKLDMPYLKLGKLTKLGYGLCFMGVW
ncbi:MAG: hypothetical protein XD40_1911 [Archaeoglobus fulgidus]|uniref:Type III-B CRISPR module-associated protein Cmr3 n=1 Tax=Archaeoglobus fulgidus TaxID=2234 RepID=A0A101DCB8_ARCFL|nr:type III-B CRISPR module-associated protein Cmr3 [Archaeoglobus fulgidus]KUJ92905.1 MAG: hypothetical protein XD40_1911 [Archaeoglobus fulgidus]